MKTRTTIIQHEGKSYEVSDEKPDFGDLVTTEEYGVWEFRDYGRGSAPMPYWANKNTCKKLILINQPI